MGVNYLSRIARRGLPVAASAGRTPGAPPKPAKASRSPVAEADQRLHLENFADALISAPFEPGGEGTDGLHDPTINESPDAGATETPARTPRLQPPAARRQRAAAPSRGSPTTEESRPRLATATPVPSLAPQDTESGVHSDIVDIEQSTTVPDTSLRTQPDPQPQRARVMRSERSASAPVPRTSEANVRSVTATPTDVLTKRLAVLERWMEADPEARPSSASHAQPAEARPAIESAAAERTPRSSHRAWADSTASVSPESRLEIGSIEVEVVAPPKAPVQQAQRMPRRSERPIERGLRSTPFGWRQR